MVTHVLNLRECTREENLYNVGSRRKTPILLENLRTGQKRVYSSKTELFKEKAIQIPRMDEPFFSKVHEVYFKATPARGNGHDDITHCHQETTTTRKETATISSLRLAAQYSIEHEPVKAKKRGRMNKSIQTRNLEGRLNGQITTQIIKKFGAYCENGQTEGVLLRSGEFSLNKMDSKCINLNNGLVTLESHLGLPIERSYSGKTAPQCWLKKMFPNGVDEDEILYRHGQRFTNDAINALIRNI
jgi:hypothetical protein